MTYLIHCPKCGKRVLVVATSKVNTEWIDDSMFKILFLQGHPKFKTTWKEVQGDAKRLEKSFNIEYLACMTCQSLYLHYGISGYYFDFLGKLTDEFIASVVSQELGNG